MQGIYESTHADMYMMNHSHNRTLTSLGWKEYWKEDQMAAPPVRCRESSATTSATNPLLCSTTSGSSKTCGLCVEGGGGWASIHTHVYIGNMYYVQVWVDVRNINTYV